MANTTGKKYGGRNKGTPNRVTSELRTVLKNLMHHELENLSELLDELEPKDRFEIIIKLLPYALPRVKNVNLYEGEPLNWDLEVR